MMMMLPQKKTRVTLVVFIIVSALEALGCTVYLLAIPPDPKHAVIFGFSGARLLMAAGFGLLFLGGLVASWWSWKNSSPVLAWWENFLTRRWLTHSLFICAMLLAWWLMRLAANGFPIANQYLAYYERIRPFMVWLSLLCFQGTMLLLWFDRSSIRQDGIGILDDRLLTLVFIPLLIVFSFFLSSVQPILYALALALYYSVAGFFRRAFSQSSMLWILLTSAFLISATRLAPIDVNLNDQDLTACDVLNITGGDTVEQDFWLLQNNRRMNRLLDDPQVTVVLRVVGDFDLDRTVISFNEGTPDRAVDLLINKASVPFYGFPVYNHLFKIPKELLRGDQLTLRISSPMDYCLAYSSGIHPLPETAHSRLVKKSGKVEDISQGYYNRRFRFQNAIYLLSDEISSDGSEVILGVIE